MDPSHAELLQTIGGLYMDLSRLQAIIPQLQQTLKDKDEQLRKKDGELLKVSTQYNTQTKRVQALQEEHGLSTEE